MPNVVGSIPEFTDDESVNKVEEVKEDETDTQAEPPAADKPADEPIERSVSEDTEVKDDVQALIKEQVERATVGLRAEIVTLREKLADSKSQVERRDISDQITQAKQEIDELQDLNPEDVSVVDRILRSKGYITKAEANTMFYESVKHETILSFLELHPEYKPENDPGDVRWKALQQEVSLYKMPEDPKLIQTLLERSHKVISSKTSSDRETPVKKQQLKTASVGAGGTQRSSSTTRLSEAQKALLLDGGWTSEDIAKIENK